VNAESGDLTTALDAWRRSVRVGPTYTQGLSFMALGHYWRGAYDSAAVWADSAIRVDNSNALARQTSSLIEVERGRFTTAEDHAQAALRLAEDVELVNARANLALVRARAGNANLARAEILAAEVGGGIYLSLLHTAVYMAEAKAAVGDIDGALTALGRYGMPRDMHFQLHLRCSPTFAPVEHDARFRAMLVIPRPAPGSHC
jgi:tetratricopeptide (TPR) repeat protein